MQTIQKLGETTWWIETIPNELVHPEPNSSQLLTRSSSYTAVAL